MFIGAYRVCPKVADVYAKVGDFYPKAWDRQTKGEGNSLSLYLQTLLLVVRKFFIGSREVFVIGLREELKKRYLCYIREVHE